MCYIFNYGSFNDNVSSSEWLEDLERRNFNLTGDTSRHNPGICLEALRKTQGASGRKSQAWLDLKWSCPKHKSEVPLLQSTCLVKKNVNGEQLRRWYYKRISEPK